MSGSVLNVFWVHMNRQFRYLEGASFRTPLVYLWAFSRILETAYRLCPRIETSEASMRGDGCLTGNTHHFTHNLGGEVLSLSSPTHSEK